MVVVTGCIVLNICLFRCLVVCFGLVGAALVFVLLGLIAVVFVCYYDCFYWC